MTVDKFLEKWYDKEIEDLGGETSPEYRNFQTNYRSVIKDFCKDIGMELHSFSKNHYDFSAVVKSNKTNQFYYISIRKYTYFAYYLGIILPYSFYIPTSQNINLFNAHQNFAQKNITGILSSNIFVRIFILKYIYSVYTKLYKLSFLLFSCFFIFVFINCYFRF